MGGGREGPLVLTLEEEEGRRRGWRGWKSQGQQRKRSGDVSPPQSSVSLSLCPWTIPLRSLQDRQTEEAGNLVDV